MGPFLVFNVEGRMLRLRSKTGQGVSGEYVLMIALIVISITAMTVYARRTLQGRMRDANQEAIKRASAALGQSMPIEYEPYYAKSSADTDSFSAEDEKIVADPTVNSLFATTKNSARSVSSASSQLPAKDAN